MVQTLTEKAFFTAVANISFDLAVQLDVDKYVNFLLSQATDKDKSDRDCVDHWHPPTKNEIDCFPGCRKLSLDLNKSFYETYAGCPLPINLIIEKECNRISAKGIFRDVDLFPALLNGRLTDKYFEMAEMVGCIDYLIWLNNVITPAAATTANDNTEPSNAAFALAYVYLAKAGKTSVTKTNKHTIAATCIRNNKTISADDLYNKVKIWESETFRTEIDREKRKSDVLKFHITPVRQACELLKNMDNNALNIANSELKNLEQKFEKSFGKIS